jgi:two-component system sensor histidine kinase PilS (NtrC family)
MSFKDIFAPQNSLQSMQPLPAADWYALRLLSNYRLFLLICITAMFYLNPYQTVLGQSHADLFHTTLIGYLIAGVVFNHLIRTQKPDHDTQFYLQAYVDIICLSLMMYASGGIQSGLGILLVANIAIIGIFSIAKYTFLFAAIATTAVLAQEFYADISSVSANTSLIKTGFTGMALFAVAYITAVVIQKRFPYRADQDSLLKNADRAEELNQRIIQQMDSGIIVIDENWQVLQINDSAIVLLGVEGHPKKKTLSDFSPQLLSAHICWKRSPFSGIKAFRNERNGTDLLPHFSRLGNRGTLISLEDYGLVAQQVQQLKLASLGGLTASIAHEIRNPLSAISNSIQLVSESEQIPSQDKHLLGIAERHCLRINRIIEDILQLSRREKNNPEQIHLAAYLDFFMAQFMEQHPHASVTLTAQCPQHIIIDFDKSHLEQILGNLCSNAIKHNPNIEDLCIGITVKASTEHEPISIFIQDNGVGIKPDIANDIFEPFYTTTHEGTGLGLFIIRELSEINQAQISYCPAKSGAAFKLNLGNTLR